MKKTKAAKKREIAFIEIEFDQMLLDARLLFKEKRYRTCDYCLRQARSFLDSMGDLEERDWRNEKYEGEENGNRKS